MSRRTLRATLATAAAAAMAAAILTPSATALPAPGGPGAEPGLSADEGALNTLPDDLARAAYLDASGRIAVPVSTADERASVAASGLVAVQRQRGARALAAQAKAIEQSMVAGGTVKAVSVDPAAAQVVVSVLQGQQGSPAAARLAAQGVRVETIASLPTVTATLVAGRPFVVPAWNLLCTAGFNARQGTRKVNITAGHCTFDGVRQFNKTVLSGASLSAPAVGTTTSTAISNGGTDRGLVTLYAATNAPGKVYHRATRKQIAVNRTPLAPYVGLLVCKEGHTTGHTCGRVTVASEAMLINWYGSEMRLTNMTRTNMCVDPGDSGGPVLTRITTTSATGVGMVSAHINGTTCAYNSGVKESGRERTWITPLKPALTAYGAKLA